MPKNSADFKKNRVIKKDNQANITPNRDNEMLSAEKAADFVPSLNGIPKNEI